MFVRIYLAGRVAAEVDGVVGVDERQLRGRQLVRALDCLANMWLESGQPSLAIENSMETVKVDPFRESSHQLLMRAHLASGDPPKAVGAYHRLRELLARELGTGPSAETEALYLEALG